MAVQLYVRNLPADSTTGLSADRAIGLQPRRAICSDPTLIAMMNLA